MVMAHVKPIANNYAMFVNPLATNAVKTAQIHSWWYEEIAWIDPAQRNSDPPDAYISVVDELSSRLFSSLTSCISSVSNGSSFGPGGYYRSAWQRPYPIKNRRFFKRTITLWPQILIREFSVCYVKYAALHGASFGRLRFSISLILSKRQPKNLVSTPKMTIMSKQLAEF